MSTTKDTCAYILDLIALPDDVTARPMMGEFLLYYRGVLIGGIYDDRLLLKETPAVAQYQLPQVLPYSSAKRTMYNVEDLDDRARLQEMIVATYQDLAPEPVS